MSAGFRDYRAVMRPVGVVLMGLGAAIGAAAAGGMVADSFSEALVPARPSGEEPLWVAAGLAVGTGALLWILGRGAAGALNRRQAMLSVALIWLAAGVFGAMPFVFGANMSLVDSFFEAVSGLTTTGATTISDIEVRLSRPLLLWRSLIQWLGGMGIVVLFVAVFPNMGVGGKHMFGEEVPGTTSEGLRPRIAETSRELWKLYLLFTSLAALVLWLLGVSFFEAVCHAFTAMATGGFSTRDASIAGFKNPAVEYALSGFMLLGTVNYALYSAALRRRSLKVFYRSTEFVAFMVIVAVGVVGFTFSLYGLYDKDLPTAFRYALFTVATTISSTGFGVDDYSVYPPGTMGLMLVLMLVGGCAGSTAGGLKVERAVVLLKMVRSEVRRAFQPNLVRVVRMGKQVVPPPVLIDVAVFFVLYMGALVAGTLGVAILEQIPVPTAFGATLTCLSNMGPSPFYLGADNFASYGAPAKLLLSAVMLLGRLEFFALLALVVPSFWRR